MTEKCLTYPILQKYYNALKHLDELYMEDDLFLNISKIDAFFAEFRSITFVMQKAFNTDKLKAYYESKKNEYLLNEDMKWFNDKRIETIHQNSFKLEKRILIDLYLPAKSFTLIDDNLTLDNELPFETIISQLKDTLLKLKKYQEVYFSILLSFKENNIEINIYDKIKKGLMIMQSFISAIIKDHPCDCTKCTKLKNEINKLLSKALFKELSFIWDGHIEDNEICFGQQGSMVLGNKNTISPIEDIRTPFNNSLFYKDCDNNINSIFELFTIMHLSIYKGQGKIMPAFMLIYDDNTFSMMPFIATTKATYYRMTTKLAKLARESNIVAVFYIGEYYSYSIDNAVISQLDYNERIKQSEKELLISCMMSKQNKHVISIDFDTKAIDCEAYITDKIKNPDEVAFFEWLQPINQSLHLNEQPQD